jgi:hypothetical protein
VKIRGNNYYIEPWSVSPQDEITIYAIFEAYKENSLLYNTLTARFERGIMQETDKGLFYDKQYGSIEPWEGTDRRIFYVRNYYDPTINRAINMAIIILEMPVN